MRYPIPARPRIEGGSDRHLLMVTARLPALRAVRRPGGPGGAWSAGSGAVFDLRSNRLRPGGWTSADAAGLPILPGLARYDEVGAGGIDHALRFTAPRTRSAFIYPARHAAGAGADPSLPPMGLRVRLKRESLWPASGRRPASSPWRLKRYGMILADNGSPWYVTGAPDRRGTTTTCTGSVA